MSKHILVFDSGIGGTSVLRHIQKKIPEAHYSYLMDNKHLPYGELDSHFLSERILKLLSYFVSTIGHVDMLVVACNTASTQTLDLLRSHFDFPIVGVVPAIKPAAERSGVGKVGLLATPATTKNEYTKNLIKNFATNSKVYLYGSSALVRLAESLFWHGECDEQSLKKEMQSLSINQDIDYLVLGCTHFPIIRKYLENYLPSSIKLIDSGEAIANRVYDLLGDVNMVENKKQPLTYYATAALQSNKLSVNYIDY